MEYPYKSADGFQKELGALEAAQDQNMQERRSLQKIREGLEEFYAWSARWQETCGGMVFAAGHSRMLLEALCASAEEHRAASELELEDLLDENRRRARRLSARRDDLVEERARARRAHGEGGGDGHRD